jgi:DNA-binding NarL/FixJ family response regulator
VIALDEAPIVRLVDAPEAFAVRVLAALPGASLIYSERPAAAVPQNVRWLAILYERDAPDRRLVAAMSSRMPTLVVTEHPNAEDALACLDSGADGYLDAAIGTSALRSALLGVAAGELAYGRDVIGLWLRTRQHKAALGAVDLTARHREILEYIARGATDKEIAAAFGMPKSTVQKQIARLLRRIGARNRAAAVAIHEGRRT